MKYFNLLFSFLLISSCSVLYIVLPSDIQVKNSYYSEQLASNLWSKYIPSTIENYYLFKILQDLRGERYIFISKYHFRFLPGIFDSHSHFRGVCFHKCQCLPSWGDSDCSIPIYPFKPVFTVNYGPRVFGQMSILDFILFVMVVFSAAELLFRRYKNAKVAENLKFSSLNLAKMKIWTIFTNVFIHDSLFQIGFVAYCYCNHGPLVYNVFRNHFLYFLIFVSMFMATFSLMMSRNELSGGQYWALAFVVIGLMLNSDYISIFVNILVFSIAGCYLEIDSFSRLTYLNSLSAIAAILYYHVVYNPSW